MNLLLLLYFLAIAPKIFIDRVLRGKRHPGFLQRLGISVPDSQGRPVIWIHAVSVGEVKSAQPLFRELKKKHPSFFFLITTISETGQREARRSLPEAGAFAYLPLDLTWVVKRWVNKLRPQLFVLIESDFWPHLLKTLKKSGTVIVLASGKLSERSARRFSYFPSFAKKLFAHFDLLCLQNEEHEKRFLPLIPDPSRLHVTGNLKLDIEPQKVDTAPWHKNLPSNVLTISCTHAPEEELLLDVLPKGCFVFLVPRHPERFNEVAELLESKQIPFVRWSQIEKKQDEQVILVDAMGQLPICYSLSSWRFGVRSHVYFITTHYKFTDSKIG